MKYAFDTYNIKQISAVSKNKKNLIFTARYRTYNILLSIVIPGHTHIEISRNPTRIVDLTRRIYNHV